MTDNEILADLWTVDHSEPGDAQRHNAEILRRVKAQVWDEAQERIAFHMRSSISYEAGRRARSIPNPYGDVS